jgi:putative DNA primase/helicase
VASAKVVAKNTPETAVEIAKLKQALAALSPDVPRGQGSLYDLDEKTISTDYWLVVVWAIASLQWECGEDIAREWSMQSPRYSDDGFDDAWSKYDSARNDAVGIGSLYKLAAHYSGRSLQKTTLVVPREPIAAMTLEFPLVSGNNKPKQVTDNLNALLQYEKIVVRYNQIKKNSECIVPGLQCVIDEADNTALTMITDRAIHAGMTADRIPEMVSAIASKNAYCPVRTYIESAPWAGQSCFHQFFAQLVTASPLMAELLVRKWMIQAVAALYEKKGLSGAGVLTFVGEQGVGKTRALKDLTAELPDVFHEGATLDPSNKDSVISAITHWIVELGELESTFKKSEISQLKAFLTRDTDVVRRPYAKRDSTYPRRTVFAGTVNEYQFLHDTTGNRRFWPIEITQVKRDTTINYQQLWAEVYTWYRSGEAWHLNDEEQKRLAQYTERFTVTDPAVDLLLQKFDFATAQSWDWHSMAEICTALGLDRATKGDHMRIAATIVKYNGKVKSQKTNGATYHYVPSLTGQTISVDKTSLRTRLHALFGTSNEN